MVNSPIILLQSAALLRLVAISYPRSCNFRGLRVTGGVPSHRRVNMNHDESQMDHHLDDDPAVPDKGSLTGSVKSSIVQQQKISSASNIPLMKVVVIALFYPSSEVSFDHNTYNTGWLVGFTYFITTRNDQSMNCWKLTHRLLPRLCFPSKAAP